MSAMNRTSASTSEPGLHPAEHVDCAVIVITYNNARHVEKLLASLPAACGNLKIRLIVVDNNSADETAAILKRSADDMIVIESKQNLGYAGAINLARPRTGSCSAVMILNPDLTLEPEAIVRLYQALDQPGVGIAVPMVLGGDGCLYLSIHHEPSLSRALGEALFGSHWADRPGWLSETTRDPRAYRYPGDVAWASGAAMLISAACDDAVGDWDDSRFFLYSEETDFASRARRYGYRVWYVPTACVRHENGGSGRSPALDALMAVNRVRYYEKYHRRPATSLFRAIVVFHHLLRATNPARRVALKALTRRSRWRDLPGGGTRPGQA